METGAVVKKSKDNMELVTSNNVPAVKIWKYHESYAYVICEKIAEGMTFKQLAKLPGMPSIATIAIWRSEHEEFDKAIKTARKMRAEGYHDEIVEDLKTEFVDPDTGEVKEIDESRLNKDAVPARKLKLDRLKYLASVNDPDTYGTRTKVSGDASAPLEIKVSTGITRE